MEVGEESAKPAEGKDAPRRPADRRKLLRGGVVGLAVLVALIAWLATRGGSSESEPAPVEAAAPRIVTEAELNEAAAALGQPIYWVGPQSGKELQLTELGDGLGVQVAYLPEGTPAGERSGRALTIGSYPLPDPEAAVARYARRPGSETLRGNGGTEVAISEAAPSSAYFAASDNSVEVEVYDPSSKRALTLAASGQVKPVG